MKVVGFDLETGSAKKLYSWSEPEDFIVLNGWIVDGNTFVSPDPQDLLKVLYDADLIYGHNIYAFDIPALAVHAGADYEALLVKAVDTRILGQQEHPQKPKTMKPATLYNLNDMADRLGVEGKTDSSKRLAEKLVAELVEKAAEGLVGKEATLARRRTKQKYKDPYDVAHLIPWWDPDLISYLEGDLESGQAVFRKLWHHMNIEYSQNELENYRNLNRMVYTGCRIDMETADQKVEEENQKTADALAELVTLCPGLPSTGDSPLATKIGKLAFEDGLRAAGVTEEDIPRTANGGVSTSRDALSEGDWIVDIQVPYGRYNSMTGEKYTEFKKKRERRKGLRQKYPDNQRVQTLCKLATTVSGKSRKYAEIRDKALADGMVHAKIGDIQVSGRTAFIEPSITNVGKRGEGLKQRSLIVPRRKGEVLMCSDLSQGDMRVMAALSQDPEYMALFTGDRDAHTEVAISLLGTPEIRARYEAEGSPVDLDEIMDKELKAIVKELRQQAKAIGHGVNYGMGIEATIANTGISREVVERYFEMRARTYRVLNQWTEKARREARTGWIEDNGFGRRMKCDPLQAHTQGPALYGQSGTREVIMRGIRQMPLEVRQMLVMVVHDEVVLSVPEERYDEIAAIVQESLRFTWRNVFFDCDVSKPGRTWSECYGLAA